ncbi:hypothetical protein MTQ10_25045 [Streptomyces sp. XM83C]|uniref:hypothetical protein n=1 Tax=unclassified Streptomyces TaxID=2593676 RepID=UPI001FFA1EB5|nr:hypothetical protein [Streptomyces sp. XM83C]MCK1822776.1 hypothetical protein [Streptomyces sp. XM83C]
MGFLEDIEVVRVECARLTSRQRLAVTALCATKVRSVSMAFLHDSGEGDSFYRINNGLDAVWLDLRGIQQASASDLMRVRDEAERWITRLEGVGGEAAGFAADAISVSVSAMSSFLEEDPEVAVNSALSIAEIRSEIAEFLAECQSAEGEYFLKGDEAGEASLAETKSDVEFLGEFPADEFPATRFMRRAGAANLALAEQMKLVLKVDRLRLP